MTIGVIALLCAALTFFTFSIAKHVPPGALRGALLLPAVLSFFSIPVVFVDGKANPFLAQSLCCVLSMTAFKVIALGAGRGCLASPEIRGGWDFAGICLLPVIPLPGGSKGSAGALSYVRMGFLKLVGFLAVAWASWLGVVYTTRTDGCIAGAEKRSLAISLLATSINTVLWYLSYFGAGVALLLEIMGVGDLVDALALWLFELTGEKHFDKIWLSRSFAEMWGRRWNLTVSSVLRAAFYDPIVEGRWVATQQPSPPPTQSPTPSRSPSPSPSPSASPLPSPSASPPPPPPMTPSVRPLARRPAPPSPPAPLLPPMPSGKAPPRTSLFDGDAAGRTVPLPDQGYGSRAPDTTGIKLGVDSAEGTEPASVFAVLDCSKRAEPISVLEAYEGSNASGPLTPVCSSGEGPGGSRGGSRDGRLDVPRLRSFPLDSICSEDGFADGGVRARGSGGGAAPAGAGAEQGEAGEEEEEEETEEGNGGSGDAGGVGTRARGAGVVVDQDQGLSIGLRRRRLAAAAPTSIAATATSGPTGGPIEGSPAARQQALAVPQPGDGQQRYSGGCGGCGNNGGALERSRPSQLRRFLGCQVVFLVSGLWHELVCYSMTRRTTGGRWLLFFAMQAPLLMLERELKRLARGMGVKIPPNVARVRTQFLLLLELMALWYPPMVSTGMLDSIVRQGLEAKEAALSATRRLQHSFSGLEPAA